MQRVPHLRIYVSKTYADGVDGLIFLIGHISIRGRNAELAIAVLSVAVRQKTKSEHRFHRNAAADLLRIDAPEELVPVFMFHILLGVGCESLMKEELITDLRRILDHLIRSIAHCYTTVEVHIVDAAVIGRQGVDHAFLLCLFMFLRQKLLLHRQLFFQLLLFAAIFGLGYLFFQHHLGGIPHLQIQ